MQISLGLGIGIAVALALIVGVVTRFATISSLKNNADSKIGNAEAKAREIIDDAVKTAETTKKEALLEVKEESIKTKNDLEKETKERRAELQRYEKRVLAKEESVDKRSDALEHRENKLTSKEEHLRQREAKVEELSQKRVQELEKLICRIYEDNILGKLPDERYAILDGQYSKEQKDLSAEIADMEAELSGYEEGRRSAEKFIALVDKYQNFEELTTYMLNEFVEKIVVHERDRKGSVETTQEVEIYFNFIGRYLPPHFGEVKMTPEEIEEMEKREARKDRLHQNYLRRKANGKQQEYYERTKAKKKAEMDAKKEEIRQEDIAKGVFVPVSLLPPAEPKKGVASA